jgi:GNAT superfamily N-acetyltransferase
VNALTAWTLGSTEYVLRHAQVDDVPAIVDLLAADPLGATRESTESDLRPYYQAFEAINADPAQVLLVVTDTAATIGTMQITFIPGMSLRGGLRAQIEAVRVHENHRGNGLGGEMVGWAIAEARRKGCVLVQLTTHESRKEAHRFYRRLGFVSSHEGFKLSL